MISSEADVSVQLQRATRRLRALSDATRDYAEATTDLPGLMEVVVRSLAAALDASCELYSLGDSVHGLKLEADYAADPELLRQLRGLHSVAPLQLRGNSALHRLLETGDASMRPSELALDSDAGSAPYSLMLVALRLHGRSIGLLRLLRPAAFDDQDMTLAQLLADHAALAIGNARSYAALVDHGQRAGQFASMAEGYTVLDHEWRFVYLDENAARQARTRMPDVIGRTPSELFPGFEQSETFAILRRCMQERTSARFESSLMHADGAAFWFEVYVRPVPEGLAILSVDNTERRRALEMLHASEARFSALSESGILGIIVGDVAGAIHEANDTFLHALGYSREELRAGALNWIELTPLELRPDCMRWAEQVQARGAVSAGEKEYLRKDGSRLSALVGLAKLDDSQLIAFILDVSEQKRNESALQQLSEQLRQAQKMEAVGRLAGGIAHDFNNILSAILGYAELIHDGLGKGHPLRRDVEELCRSGRRAADLTKQLLIFSRRQVLKPKVVDLKRVLSGMQDLLQRVLGEDVELQCAIEPELGRVEADPSSIELVIMNLAVNARDAMPEGGQLRIEARNVEVDEQFAQTHLGARPGPHVLLAVTDTGIGMDAATVAQVFDPFFTTKDPGKGTGLGLATVFGTVQQSGGTVWIDSQPGYGTRASVYLPRTLKALDQPPVLDREQIAGGSETILLVEDQEEVRAVARDILIRSGYQVIAAKGAAAALRISDEYAGRIDLLLSDVVMPMMSGPELARRLLVARPDLRVLCMSGYTYDSVLRNGLLEGELPFLPKPFTPAALTIKLREVLAQPPRARVAKR